MRAITHLPPILDSVTNADGSECLRVSTGTPGAPVQLSELANGAVVELNGAGSVVAVTFPRGVAGIDFDGMEW